MMASTLREFQTGDVAFDITASGHMATPRSGESYSRLANAQACGTSLTTLGWRSERAYDNACVETSAWDQGGTCKSRSTFPSPSPTPVESHA